MAATTLFVQCWCAAEQLLNHCLVAFDVASCDQRACCVMLRRFLPGGDHCGVFDCFYLTNSVPDTIAQLPVRHPPSVLSWRDLQCRFARVILLCNSICVLLLFNCFLHIVVAHIRVRLWKMYT